MSKACRPPMTTKRTKRREGRDTTTRTRIPKSAEYCALAFAITIARWKVRDGPQLHQARLTILDNRDDLIRPESGALADAIVRQNHLMSKVRQTGDATLDSRVLVLASDYAAKKLNASLHGNVGVGVDVDQFVSRCIFFMKEGRPAGSKEVASTQAPRRRQPVPEDEEDEENNGEGLDWALLGRYACFPNNKRPPVSSFLLGPLSVQKRARLQTRRARAQRQPLGPATRPQELRHEDIIQSENSNLTNLVKGIKTRLQQHINDGEVQIEEELKAYPNYDDEDVSAACKRYRVYQTPEGEAAVSLFDFAINPRSFGQTVENLFYISFLIREGAAKVLTDADELPLLGECFLPCLPDLLLTLPVPEEPRNLQQQRELHVEKHQAIFSLDWPTWKTLIKAFDIKVPLIPHRVPDETNVTAGGWYG